MVVPIMILDNFDKIAHPFPGDVSYQLLIVKDFSNGKIFMGPSKIVLQSNAGDENTHLGT